MRALQQSELVSVAGGFGQGTKVPFRNLYWKGPNFPGGPAAVLPAVTTAWEFGNSIGEAINWFNSNVTGMSLGVAVYRTFNGGSNISTTKGTVRVEEEV